jgi:hypothetical protein
MKGGVFHGAGILCDTTACPQPPFVGEESGAKHAQGAEVELLGPSKTLVVYPNPSRGEAVIVFRTRRNEDVDLAVFDVAGRRIADVARGVFPSGEWNATWNGLDGKTGAQVPPGIYFLRLATGTASVTERLTVVR